MLSTTFPDRPCSSGDHGRPEKDRVSRPRVFLSMNPIAHPSQLLDDDDDDDDDGDEDHDHVVDMMVRQLAMTTVRNSEVS